MNSLMSIGSRTKEFSCWRRFASSKKSDTERDQNLDFQKFPHRRTLCSTPPPKAEIFMMLERKNN